MCEYFVSTDGYICAYYNECSKTNEYASILDVTGEVLTVCTKSGEKKKVKFFEIRSFEAPRAKYINSASLTYTRLPDPVYINYTNVLNGILIIYCRVICTEIAKNVVGAANCGYNQISITFADGSQDIFEVIMNDDDYSGSIISLSSKTTYVITETIPSQDVYCTKGLMDEVEFTTWRDESNRLVSILADGTSFYNDFNVINIYRKDDVYICKHQSDGFNPAFHVPTPRTLSRPNRLPFRVHPTGLIMYTINKDVYVVMSQSRQKLKCVKKLEDGNMMIYYKKHCNIVTKHVLVEDSKYFKHLNPHREVGTLYFIHDGYMFTGSNDVFKCTLDGKYYDYIGYCEMPKVKCSLKLNDVYVKYVDAIKKCNGEAFAFMPGDITITAEIATQIDDIVICAHDMLFRFAVKFADGLTKLAFLSISEELIFEDNTVVKITTPRGEPKYCRRGQYQKCGVSLDEDCISAKVNGAHVMFPNLHNRSGEIYMHGGKYLLEDDEGNNHLGIVTINPASKKIKPALH